MKLIADENIDAAIIAWLRSQGEDVLSVYESMRGSMDETILARAVAENRIIVTKDRDFGELIYHGGFHSAGVILLRLEGALAQVRLSIVQSQWKDIALRAAQNFVVVSQGRLRVRPIPPTR